jgi:cellulose synthase/poly-beta-1,6-N-acetylglucosamine synthase-like glycosyltransferase
MTLAAPVFWGSAALVGYAYVGYPLLAWMLGRFSGRPSSAGASTPSITVVIAAHNEEARIGTKLENCLDLDYPAGLLNVLVVSDGSTDRTAAVVSGYAERFPGRVDLIEVAERRGKASALNAAAAQATGELLLLADVRQRFDRGVALSLARHFHDPKVGAVSGELILLGPGQDELHTGLGMYWRYEKFLRRAESRWGSSMGYTGAVSAVRRGLFTPLSPDTLVDDLVVALRVIARGYRVLFDPAAKAYDTISREPGREFGRKVRTLAGTLQTGLESGRLVGRLSAGIWLQLLSHKLLRLMVPFLLVAAWVSSALADEPFYRAAWMAQTAGYGLGVLALLFPAAVGKSRVGALASTFLMLNTAAAVGVFSYLGGSRLELWQAPAPDRTPASDSSVVS